MSTPSWRLLALACAILAAAYSNAQDLQQQQQQLQQQSNLKNSPNGNGNLKRLGLAPHERPACRLPIGTGQRRLASSQTNHHQQQQRHHPLAGSSPALSSQATTTTTTTAPLLELGTPATSSLRSNQTRYLVTQSPLMHHHHQQQPKSVLVQTQTQPRPRTQVDSSERLRQIRQLMLSNNYDGYLIGPNDEHGSEYVTEYDRRLRFISGFSGSNGYALILLDRAVLFTDGRYELQADADLDCNWWLVVGQEQFSDIISWLKGQNASNLRIGTDARLMSLSAFDYLDEQLRGNLDSEFALISQDLVDIVWDGYSPASNDLSIISNNNGRLKPDGPLQVYAREFAGHLSWQEKVLRLAELMQQSPHRASHYVVAKLDDIAWLLNLRGSDIPMSPLFKAYLFISRQQQQPTLDSTTTTNSKPLSSVEQLLSATIDMQQPPIRPTQQRGSPSGTNAMIQINQTIRIVFYVDLKKITPSVREHLHLSLGTNETLAASKLPPPISSGPDNDNNGLTYLGSNRIQIELKDYDVFLTDFREKFALKTTGPSSMGAGTEDHLAMATPSQSPIRGRLLLDSQANVAIHVLAKSYENRTILVEPLIQRLKAVKSNSEVQGMRLAHWRDSLAIAMLLSQLEQDLELRPATAASGQVWTETSSAKELEYLRSLMDFNRGQSFDTISAYGSNGAIVHYRPPASDNEPLAGGEQRVLGNDSTYLLDSGGQYLDGTTDITRTLHFGTPSDWQRETYTRVLMGAIDMMSLVFPGGDQMGPGKKLNDLLARRHLLELGLDYSHGTGHGIGSYSLVHEAPWLIEHYAAAGVGACSARQPSAASSSNSPKSGAQVYGDALALQANMFTSVEPGYYEAGQFGIRLENIVVTQPFEVSQIIHSTETGAGGQESNFSSTSPKASHQKNLLRFEPISLVPFEPKLIKFDLLSNKQKAWLNSYNLMVRLRMTQQINYYLARVRQHSDGQLARQQQQQQHLADISSNNNKTQQLAESQFGSNQPNFLRMAPERFQSLLEQAHRWILKKTELIPLDLPQRYKSNNQPIICGIQAAAAADDDDSPLGAKSEASSRASKDSWSMLGTDAVGQRLMLAYMAQLPFGDSDAAQAAASLLGGRADQPALGGQNSEKCSGIECDLLLLEALNAHHAAHQRQSNGIIKDEQQQQQQQQDQNWKSNPESSSSLGATSEPAGQSTWDKWRQQLMDLFQLSGDPSSASSDNASNGDSQHSHRTLANFILANMWPLICVGALLVLVIQFALMLYVCSGGGNNSNNSSPGQSNSNNSNIGRHLGQSSLSLAQRFQAGSNTWHTTGSGRRLARLGDSLGSSFRLGRSKATTNNNNNTCDNETELTAVV